MPRVWTATRKEPRWRWFSPKKGGDIGGSPASTSGPGGAIATLPWPQPTTPDDDASERRELTPSESSD